MRDGACVRETEARVREKECVREREGECVCEKEGVLVREMECV